MKKRLLSVLLVVVMVLSMLPTAFAEETAEYGPIGENLIVNGSFENGANYFHGDENIKRGEMAKIICKINDYIK